ncbi:hypothetical protein LguiA_011966 [Lonicera macranthoides]
MIYDSNAGGDDSNGCNVRAPIVIAVDQPTDQVPVPCRSEITVGCSVNHKEGESKNDGLFKCYKRRRVSACIV